MRAAPAVQSWWEDRVEKAGPLSDLIAGRDELHDARDSIAEKVLKSGRAAQSTNAVLVMLADPNSAYSENGRRDSIPGGRKFANASSNCSFLLLYICNAFAVLQINGSA